MEIVGINTLFLSSRAHISYSDVHTKCPEIDDIKMLECLIADRFFSKQLSFQCTQTKSP